MQAIFKEGVAQGITSGSFIRRHQLKSPSSVQAAIKKLLDADIVTMRDKKYSIEDPLLSLWLEARQ